MAVAATATALTSGMGHTSAAAAAVEVQSRHLTARRGATTSRSAAAAACQSTIFASTALETARQRMAALQAGMAPLEQLITVVAEACLRVASAPKTVGRFMAAALVPDAPHTLAGGIIGLVAAAVITAAEVETWLLAADHLILQACWAPVVMRLLRGRHRALPENRLSSGCLA